MGNTISKRDSRASEIGHLLAVVLLPALVLWRQDNSLFTGSGYLDPWYYLGFFRNLVEFKRDLFPGTYYGSRLSVILPGAALQGLFPAVTANCLLHLGVHTAATVALFLTLKWVAGVRRAFLASLLFSANPWLWSATGWDNPDGFAIAYCLMTMALLTWAALAPVRRWALVAAGMTLACLVYANLFWVTLAPLLPLTYLGLTRLWHGTPLVRSLVSLCGWMGAGCAAVTIVLGTVNYSLDGHFFFYAPSVLEALNLHGVGPRWDSPWQGYAPAPWLWLAAVAAIAAVAGLVAQRRTWREASNAAAVLFAAQFWCALAWMAYTQAHGNAVLGIYYYACFLLPFGFLVIGTWFWPGVDALGTWAYLLTCVAGAAIYALAWLAGTTGVASRLPHAGLAGAVILAASFAARRRAGGAILSLLGFGLLLAPGIALRYGGLEPHQFRRQYESIIHARSRIEAVRQGHAVRFWYDGKDRAMPDGTALSSTYLWSASLVAESFSPSPCDAELVPSTILAVISADPAHGWEFAQSTLAGCWNGRGLRAVPVESDVIDRGSYRYTLSLLRVEPIPGEWIPLAAVAGADGQVVLRDAPDAAPPAAFPPQFWSVAAGEDSRAQLRTVMDGVEVRTHARPESLAALYPTMAAPVTGWYRFRMRMWPGAGLVRFGAYGPGGAARWLGYSAQRYWNGSDSDIVFWVSLAAGQEFQLGLANDNEGVRLPASLLMKEVTAVRVRAPEGRR